MSVLTRTGYPLASLWRSSCPRLRGGNSLYLTQRRASSSVSLNPLKWFTKRPDSQPSSRGSAALEPASTQPEPDYHEEDVMECIEGHTHKFIPVTRSTLLKALTMEKGMFTTKERTLLDDFAAALDAYYSQKFYGILEESKLLYDYLDPDKDTFQTRDLSKKELLDQEYWLLQKVEKLLDKANYFQIPRHQFTELLKEHDSEGVTVSVNPDEYDMLKIWTRGLESRKRSNWERFKSYLNIFVDRKKDRSITDPRYTIYSRVFVAVRSRLSKTLHLKVFKEVPCNKLEHLLPDGKIKMSKFDKQFFAASVVVGGCILASRLVPVLADMKVQWAYIGVGLTGFIGARAWIGYKNKRNHYLASLASTLYYRTVANNRGVLTLLTDRAQDEEFKEALLAYAFLLSPRNRRGIPGTEHTAGPPIWDTADSLQTRIEEWLTKRFSIEDMQFDIEDALFKLDNLGLLLRHTGDKLSVRGLEESLSVLPQPREEWVAVSALRDSESSDELMNYEEINREVSEHGWR